MDLRYGFGIRVPFLLLLTTLTIGSAWAGEGLVAGEVRNNIGQTLPDATLELEGTGRVFDLEGERTFSIALTPGRHVLRARAFGYRVVRRAFLVEEGQTTSIDFVRNSLIHRPYKGSSLEGLKGHGLRTSYQVLGTPLQPIQTASNGSFGGYLPQGVYQFEFSAPGYYSQVLEVSVPGGPYVAVLKPLPVDDLVGDRAGRTAGERLEAAGLDALGQRDPGQVERLVRRRGAYGELSGRR